MRAPALFALALTLAGPTPAPGDCSSGSDGASRCIYRSLFPSAGIVASCQTASDCRVGYYYGNPGDAVWFSAPPGLASLPRPEVIWLTSTLAEVRFDCGPPCSWSYFFEATRRRLSEPRASVLAADPRRLLIVTLEAPALVV